MVQLECPMIIHSLLSLCSLLESVLGMRLRGLSGCAWRKRECCIWPLKSGNLFEENRFCGLQMVWLGSTPLKKKWKFIWVKLVSWTINDPIRMPQGHTSFDFINFWGRGGIESALFPEKRALQNWHHKWLRPRGVWPRGIQIGPYSVHKTYFRKINLQFFKRPHAAFPFYGMQRNHRSRPKRRRDEGTIKLWIILVTYIWIKHSGNRQRIFQ